MSLPAVKPMLNAEVAILDLSDLRHPDIAVRRNLGRRMAQVCRDVGFFYIVNHGIGEDRIGRMFELGRQFFDLPVEDKMAIAMAKTRSYRGYLPMKTLGNDPNFKGNIHESFHVWQEHAPDDPDLLAGKPLHDVNQWPARMPELRSELLDYVTEATRLVHDMMKVVALGIDLPESTFVQFFDKPISLLRFIHYPPQEASEVEGRYGVRPHTDNGVFTLLAQDDTGGLEILGQDGSWLTVPPVKGSFVVNLGEMMKVWSNGLFLATPHRVVNRYGKERYSIPFFLNPRYDALIEPILKQTGTRIEPVLHTTVSRDQPNMCGDILMRLYRRIWPSLDATQVN